jgi:hypothetical protein
MRTGGDVNIYSDYAGLKWGYVPREVRTSHSPTSGCQWHVTKGLLDGAFQRRVPYVEAQGATGLCGSGDGPRRRPEAVERATRGQSIFDGSSNWGGRNKALEHESSGSGLFPASLSMSGCRCLSERACWVPRLASIGLRRSHAREAAGTATAAAETRLADAREHGLWGPMESRGSARGARTADAGCFVGLSPHGRMGSTACGALYARFSAPSTRRHACTVALP